MVKITKGQDGRYYKPCSRCGELQSYLRKNYAEESLRLKKMCKACANRITENSNAGFYEDIRLSWFNKVTVGAETRGLKFELELEDIWNLYVEQDGKCALSGLPIGWAEVGQNHTASIDRIDSSYGYLKCNIQLVHKDINFMKQQYSNEYFIELATKVAEWSK
jgi:hypothetical protein